MLFRGLVAVFLLLAGNFAQAQFKVIGYVPNWIDLLGEVKRLDMTKVTHVNVAFINPNASGTLSPSTNLKAAADYCHSNNVKILASIAGASASKNPLLGYYQTLTNDANRSAFVAKLVTFAVDNNLDGIDVDLEGDAVGADYEKFVVALKTELAKKNLLMSAAVGTWYSNRITDNALAQFDFINLMSYDATGPWAPNNAGPHSPYSMAVNDLNHWVGTRGLAKEKVTVGVPFYGYYFYNGSSGSVTYADIVKAYPGSENKDVLMGTAYGDIYYNGIPTIKSKTQLALSSAGGVMFWQSEQDAVGELSLLKAIDDVIRSSTTNDKPLIEIIAPLKGSTIMQGDSLYIKVNATDNDGTIFKVEAFLNGVKMADIYSAPYIYRLVASDSGNFRLIARTLDNLSAASTDTVDFRIEPITGEVAYGKTPWAIPGTIQAEHFNVGNNGVAYHDLTPGNTGGEFRNGSVDIEACLDIDGGYDVGWIQSGEWLNYNVLIAQDTIYDIESRVASQSTLSNKFHLKVDNVNVTGSIIVPNTTGWQKWVSVKTTKVALTAGLHKLTFVSESGEYNVNWFKFKMSDSGPATSVNDELSTKANASYIAPNPVNLQSVLHIAGKANTVASVGIYDAVGSLISYSDVVLSDGDNLIPIQADTYTSGIYYCKVITQVSSQTIPFVVK